MREGWERVKNSKSSTETGKASWPFIHLDTHLLIFFLQSMPINIWFSFSFSPASALDIVGLETIIGFTLGALVMAPKCTIPIRPHPITPTLTSLSSTAIFKADLLATVPKEGANPSTEEPARAYKRAITDSFILIDVQKLLEQDIDCWLMDGDEWMNLQWPKCRYAWRRLDSDQMQIIIVSSFLSWWWMHVDATWKTSVCGAPMFVKGFKVCVFPAAKSGLTSVISRWIEFFYREILSVIFITVDIVPLVKWVNRAVNRWTNVTWPYVD